MKITIYKSTSNFESAKKCEPQQIIELIQVGFDEETRRVHELIRKSSTKEETIKLKSSLQAIAWSGVFKEGTRSEANLIRGTGFLQIDLNNFKSNSEIDSARELLKKIPSVYAIFDSASGTGLNTLVRCKVFKTSEEYGKTFISFQNKYTLPNFDSKTIDISRCCYIPLSENVYVNFKAVEYDTKEENINKSILKASTINSIEDVNYCLKNTNNMKIYEVGNNNNFVQKSNFKESRLVLVKEEEGPESSSTQFDLEDDESTYADIENEQFGKHDNAIIDLKTSKNHKKFYSKDNKGNISVDIADYFKFLKTQGFYKRNIDSSFDLISIEDNVADFTSESKIEDKIKKNIPAEIYSYMKNRGTKYFGKSFLSGLDNIDISTLKDSKNCSFIPFLNGVVKVLADSISIIDYTSLERPVWRNNIIKRDFLQMNDAPSKFEDFIMKVCANDIERFNYFRSIIGYLLHNYKSHADARAIIFNDETISDVADGRSGKSLVANAIGHIRSLKLINGKSGENDFMYEGTTEEHDIVSFDDVVKNFDLESKFPLITSDFVVQRKGIKNITIPFNIAPKILISTNYVIAGDTGSFEARRHEVEFHQYFTAQRTPEMIYGERFFENWSTENWASFDSWMLTCIQIYLKSGIVKVVNNNLMLKKLHQGTSPSFVAWITDENESQLSSNTIYSKGAKFAEFLSTCSKSNSVGIRLFMQWIKKYADYKNLSFKEFRSKGNRCFSLSTEK
ncbi:BT4734/BF3469 family protein [Flavobacterium sp. PL12]|uniref:BT4734/BF3469 family protein n=1 Tax=Flavobacterium sp. PL12 TaxID=3071718 RepID=UPI00319E7292